MKLKVTVLGKRELAARLKLAIVNAPIRVGQAMREEGETIMTRSKRDFVPVDFGILRASGFVDGPEIKGDIATVTLGYGGAASAYALIQHERMEYHHTVGQAKYLEQPVNEAVRGFSQRVAKRIGRKII